MAFRSGFVNINRTLMWVKHLDEPIVGEKLSIVNASAQTRGTGLWALLTVRTF